MHSAICGRVSTASSKPVGSCASAHTRGPWAAWRSGLGKASVGQPPPNDAPSSCPMWPHFLVTSPATARSRSEIVVPVLGPAGELIAVFDVDADRPYAFDHVDAVGLERLLSWFAEAMV